MGINKEATDAFNRCIVANDNINSVVDELRVGINKETTDAFNQLVHTPTTNINYSHNIN